MCGAAISREYDKPLYATKNVYNDTINPAQTERPLIMKVVGCAGDTV